MAASISVACGNVDDGSGDIRATIDAVHISCDGADVWDDEGVPKQYRFRVDAPDDAQDLYGSAYSELFTPSEDGKHTWEGYIFPAAGSHTIALHDELENSNAATLAVTVV